jgi:ADP-ribosylglycohydrolase
MSQIPPRYQERVYAGVLGKIIGVLLGRPFEMWDHQRIIDELGPIHYYVHERLGKPLLVVDDDISGTFTFVRALEEHQIDPNGQSDEISRQIGQTWLNNVVEKRSVFWWGGYGISTEHTAFRNLTQTVNEDPPRDPPRRVTAPESGAIAKNGQTIAEQIGAQIFIDGWGMVAPGQPELAAQLAKGAARVSHDGEAVNAAVLWAVMEAEAFNSDDVDHLLDTGLRAIDPECLVARLIADVRSWTAEDGDWNETRQRIQDNYGYDRYPGTCHIIPNHGIMIMALLYGGSSFDEAMHIINTCGWDTDCNSGNVGCLLALMHGLAAFEGDRDWRGPLYDRVLISSADGGYSINNAARIALDIANHGRRLAGEMAVPPPKRGAQFHFTLPGSVQGFHVAHKPAEQNVSIRQDSGDDWSGLAIKLPRLDADDEPVEVMTDTFVDQTTVDNLGHYELMACPLIYPGQRLSAVVYSSRADVSSLKVRLRIKAYNSSDQLETFDGEATEFQDGMCNIRWQIPSEYENQPIQQIGIAFSAEERFDGGTVRLDFLKFTGAPQMILRRPEVAPGEAENSNKMWHRSWVNAVETFHNWGPSFQIAHDQGEGMISQGTRQWKNYKVVVSGFQVQLSKAAGVAVRVQGIHRWYALMFLEDTNGGRRVALMRARDNDRILLIKAGEDLRDENAPRAEVDFDWSVDEKYEVTVSVEQDTITASVGPVELQAIITYYGDGGMGLVVSNGSLSAQSIEVRRTVDDD